MLLAPSIVFPFLLSFLLFILVKYKISDSFKEYCLQLNIFVQVNIFMTFELCLTKDLDSCCWTHY